MGKYSIVYCHRTQTSPLIFPLPSVSDCYSSGYFASVTCSLIVPPQACSVLAPPRVMPARVRIPQRIVVRVRVAVPRQGIPRAGDEGVRLGKPSQGGVVPAGVVVHQPEGVGVRVLAGVGAPSATLQGCYAIVRRQCAGLVAHFTPRIVERAGAQRSVGVRGDGGRAEVVAEDVGQLVAGERRIDHQIEKVSFVKVQQVCAKRCNRCCLV